MSYRMKFKILLQVVMAGLFCLSAQAEYCSRIMKAPETVNLKFQKDLEMSFEQLTSKFKQFKQTGYTPQSNVLPLIVQTSILSGKPLSEVIPVFKENYEVAGLEAGLGNAVVAQTIVLLDRPASEVVEFFRKHENSTVWKPSTATHNVVIQTALLSNRKVEHVAEYFSKFPRTVSQTKQLSHGIIIQTSFLLGLSAKDSIQYYRHFPYIPGVVSTAGQLIIAQTAISLNAGLPEKSWLEK